MIDSPESTQCCASSGTLSQVLERICIRMNSIEENLLGPAYVKQAIHQQVLVSDAKMSARMDEYFADVIAFVETRCDQALMEQSTA